MVDLFNISVTIMTHDIVYKNVEQMAPLRNASQNDTV